MPSLDAFLEWVSALPHPLIYGILGLSAFIENLFPPVPGDTVTAFGAFLVGAKQLRFAGVYVSTTLGSVLGFMCLFWIGRLLGRRFFMEKDLWVFKAADILRAEAWFKKYGYFLVLMNRFLPGIRSVISLSGGISKLRSWPVVLFALASACAWNGIWIGFGYILGSNWENVKDRIGNIMARYNTAVFALLGLIVFCVVLRWWVRKRKTGTKRN